MSDSRSVRVQLRIEVRQPPPISDALNADILKSGGLCEPLGPEWVELRPGAMFWVPEETPFGQILMRRKSE